MAVSRDGGDVVGTQRLIEEGSEHLARLADLRSGFGGKLDVEATVAAFNTFRSGVLRASTSAAGGLEDVIDTVEPKAAIISLLVDLHYNKRLYRKQVIAVFELLIRRPGWCRTFISEISAQIKAEPSHMLDDIRALNDAAVQADAVAEVHAAMLAAQPAPTTPIGVGEQEGGWSSQSSSHSRRDADDMKELREAGRRAIRDALAENRNDPVLLARRGRLEAAQASPAELLHCSLQAMEALDFGAAATGTASEESVTGAFEMFHRAAVQAHRHYAGSGGENAILDALEPKRKILSFLIDVCSRHPMYRSQGGSVLRCLLRSDASPTEANSDEAGVGAVLMSPCVNPWRNVASAPEDATFWQTVCDLAAATHTRGSRASVCSPTNPWQKAASSPMPAMGLRPRAASDMSTQVGAKVRAVSAPHCHGLVDGYLRQQPSPARARLATTPWGPLSLTTAASQTLPATPTARRDPWSRAAPKTSAQTKAPAFVWDMAGPLAPPVAAQAPVSAVATYAVDQNPWGTHCGMLHKAVREEGWNQPTVMVVTSGGGF